MSEILGCAVPEAIRTATGTDSVKSVPLEGAAGVDFWGTDTRAGKERKLHNKYAGNGSGVELAAMEHPRKQVGDGDLVRAQCVVCQSCAKHCLHTASNCRGVQNLYKKVQAPPRVSLLTCPLTDLMSNRLKV